MFSASLVSKLLRLWPFDRGHLRIYNFLSDKTKAEFDTLPQPTIMNSGLKLYVRPDDHLSQWFRCFGTYEPRTSRILREYASKDTVFVDVGANLGLHSLGVARDVGCHVVAFEPHKETADCLDQSIEVNELGSLVKVMRVALSNEDGTATLVQPLTHAGKSSLLGPNPHFREGGHSEVAVAQLDKLTEFHEHLNQLGKKVGLIKMDIEGAEERALHGMATLLKEHRPVVVIELCDGNLFGFVSSTAAVVKLMEGWGYELAQELEWNGIFVPK